MQSEDTSEWKPDGRGRYRRMDGWNGEGKIVEHTENDRYWGAGGDGSGKNRLGQTLMRARGVASGGKAMNPIIRPERTADHAAILEVNQSAFGGEDEARLVDALREGGYARVSLVAEEDGRVVGHILFSALTIATSQGNVEALALAPMAVVPSHQRKGIGSSLVGEGLRACREAGNRIVIVVGHSEFYPRFGFSPMLAEPLRSRYSGPACMALELVTGALEGVEGEARYPPPFEGQ